MPRARYLTAAANCLYCVKQIQYMGVESKSELCVQLFERMERWGLPQEL